MAALLLVGLCAACASTQHENAFPERARPTPPPSPDQVTVPAPGESQKRWGGPAECTITRVLSPGCAACVHGSCCSPPVPYTQAVAGALSCMAHCREPLPPQEPPLSEEDIAAARAACRGQCTDESGDRSGHAAQLEGCIYERCSAECRRR